MRLSPKLAGVILCAAAALALISAQDARGFRRYLRLQDDVAQLGDKNRQLSEQNGRLAREIEALRKEPRAIERALREELGYVRPGEVVVNLE